MINTVTLVTLWRAEVRMLEPSGQSLLSSSALQNKPYWQHEASQERMEDVPGFPLAITRGHSHNESR